MITRPFESTTHHSHNSATSLSMRSAAASSSRMNFFRSSAETIGTPTTTSLDQLVIDFNAYDQAKNYLNRQVFFGATLGRRRSLPPFRQASDITPALHSRRT